MSTRSAKVRVVARGVAVSLFLVGCTVAASGCISLGPAEREMLQELKAVGIEEDCQTVKNPGLAGALNILPGFGNFYLAYGAGESEMWTVGFLNLLFWPPSIIWAVPEAAIDATTINKRHTVWYYKYSEQGKRELDERKAALATPS